MTKLLKREVHGVKSCYDVGDGGCCGGQMHGVASAESKRRVLCKRIACMMTRLLFVMLLCVVGCKENYESPEAFIKHWVIDGEAKRYCSDERMKELHFKGIEVSNARISTKDGESTVFATLRFVPDSDKIVYAFKDNFPQFIPNSNNNPKDFGLQIISQEELKKWVTADLKMPRIRMDNGIFAPIDMDNNIKYIHGWGVVGSLMVVSEQNITEKLRKLLVDAKSLQNPNAKNVSNKAMVIMRIASYASSGELDFIKDKKLLEELGEACMGILVLIKNEQFKLQLVRYFGEKTITAFVTLSEMLRARGITVNGSKDLAGLIALAKKGLNLFVAITSANTEREALGFDSVWPKSRKHLSNDNKDISGVEFADSGHFFKTLFDLPNRNKPYVSIDASAAIEGTRILWSVALDPDESISDQAPILVSANFDCSKLPSKWPDGSKDIDQIIPLNNSAVLDGKGVVIVTKGGKVISLPSNKVTLRNVYGEGAFVLPKRYLTPNGAVAVGR